MKVLILCDRSSADLDGFNLQKEAAEAIRQAGCEVRTVVLSCDEIGPCIGCFGCWIKTPGLCVITGDPANDIAREEMNCDAVVLLSKVTFGGFSPDVKAFLDRSIPNISPLFEIYGGKMHHVMRYEKFPCWIAVGYGESTREETEIFHELVERNALNMRPQKHFCLTAREAGEYPGLMLALKEIFTREVGA